MKLTPLDLRQKRFSAVFRGVDPREVESFLEFAATEFEALIREHGALKDALATAQGRIQVYAERERVLQDTLITAQRLSEEIKDSARKEAEIRVAEAVHQGEKIVQDAQARLLQVVNDIAELKRQRAQLESELRSVIEGHQKLLEAFGTQGQVEDKVSFFTPRRTGQQDG
jgi:cell division initiation protein